MEKISEIGKMSGADKMSRQKRWQIKKRSEGLCITCGKLPIYKGGWCRRHHRAITAISKRHRDKNSEYYRKKGIEFRKKNPDYAKNYYLAHKKVKIDEQD